jgi:hypothetical protein
MSQSRFSKEILHLDVERETDRIISGDWCDSASSQAALNRHGYQTGDLGCRDADGKIDRKGCLNMAMRRGGRKGLYYVT